MTRFDFLIPKEETPVYKRKPGPEPGDSLDTRPLAARGRVVQEEPEELPDEAVSPLPEEQTFWVKDGRGIGTEILSKTKIGEGFFGVAYQAEVLAGNKRRTFVIKEFKPQEGRTKEQLAQQAQANYLTAKAAGLKVWPTYRLNREGDQILMTNGNLERHYCLGTNSGLSEQTDQKIKAIPNFLQVAEEMFKQAAEAGDKGIQINGDAYFYLIKKGTENPEIDFLVGDFDRIEAKEDLGDNEKADNLRNVSGSLLIFLRNVDNERWVEEQREVINRLYRKYYQILCPPKRRAA